MVICWRLDRHERVRRESVLGRKSNAFGIATRLNGDSLRDRNTDTRPPRWRSNVTWCAASIVRGLYGGRGQGLTRRKCFERCCQTRDSMCLDGETTPWLRERQQNLIISSAMRKCERMNDALSIDMACSAVAWIASALAVVVSYRSVALVRQSTSTSI
jgi:hypothetical protein